MAGEDQIRDNIEQYNRRNKAQFSRLNFLRGVGEVDNELPIDDPIIWKKTFERNRFQDPTVYQDIIDRAKSSKKIGEDPLPPGIMKETPNQIVEGALDGLGDWRQNYKNINYPGVDFKTGFTKPPVYPTEYSKFNYDPTNLKTVSQPAQEQIKVRKQYYNNFEDFSGKQFTHLLDYFSAQKGIGDFRPIPDPVTAGIKDIYLGSFIKTFDENEDPTMLGYDLTIKIDQSPLFNGTVESFIKQFAGYGNSEIAARLEIYGKFKEQFFKFFKNDQPSSQNSPVFDGTSGTKTYYLKKIGGLNGLNDQSDGNESKQFVDYGKTFITLGFYEDVTQNLGYLASLYKSLAYSRLNGKQIIPGNVLRFDVDITITEVKKYNRVFKNLLDNKLDIVVDKISKYVYTLYECQFFFPTLPHGDAIDMWKLETTDEFEFKFNYKWSTLRFDKIPPMSQSTQSNTPENVSKEKIDNKQLVPSQVMSDSTTNNSIQDAKIVSEPAKEPLKEAGAVNLETNQKVEVSISKGGDLESTIEAAKNLPQEAAAPTALIKDTTNAALESKPDLGNIGAQLAKSSTNFLSEATNPSQNPNFGFVAGALEKIKSSAISPTMGAFTKNLVGGGLIGGNIGALTSNLNISNIGNALGKINASAIAPQLGAFTKNLVGGSLQGGNLLNAIPKNLNISSVTNALKSINASAIAPTIGNFTKNLVGGALKGGNLLNALPGNLNLGSVTNALKSINASAIAPQLGAFTKNLIGGTLKGGNLLNAIPKNLNLGSVGDALKRINTSAIAPQIGAFTKNLIGGTLQGGNLLNAIPKNLNLGSVTNALKSINASAIAPTLGNFTKNLVGGALKGGNLLNAIPKNLNLGSVTNALKSINASAIAPTLGNFTKNLVGGALKGGNLLNAIPKNLNLGSVTNALKSINASAIAPTIGNFTKNLVGGALKGGNLLNAIPKNLNLSSVTNALKSINASAIAPTIGNFTKNLVGGALKGGDLLNAIPKNLNLGNIGDALKSINTSAIVPQLGAFTKNLIGGTLQGGNILNSLPVNLNLGKVTDALKSINASAIAPQIGAFTKNLVGGAIQGVDLGSTVGNVVNSVINNKPIDETLKGLSKQVNQQFVIDQLDKLKSSVISPSVKGFAQDIIGGAPSGKPNKTTVNNIMTSQASLLNKTLANISNVVPISTKPLTNSATNKVQNFVGQSLRGFFTKPK
jgi:hypothetical protein